MFYGAAPYVFRFAEELRRKQTSSEKILWEAINGKKLGVKFRRQHPIRNYIADFYCHEKKLVIEIDGNYHLEIDQKEYDKYRSDDIEELGISVIRFTNDEVITDIESVVSKIKLHISKT